MSTFKKAKVVMLPTNEKPNLVKVYSDGNRINNKLIISSLGANDNYKENIHLYIISDDEIKKGDWVIEYQPKDNLGELHQIHNEYVLSPNIQKKVIATTDDSLYYKNNSKNPKQYMGSYISMSLGENLPRPSQQFIQKFVEEYNRGNIIEDVFVEYEEYDNQCDGLSCNICSCDPSKPDLVEKLKINSKNNTIIIKKVKDNYSREEVENLIYSAMKDRCYTTIAEWKKWIEENL